MKVLHNLVAASVGLALVVGCAATTTSPSLPTPSPPAGGASVTASPAPPTPIPGTSPSPVSPSVASNLASATPTAASSPSPAATVAMAGSGGIHAIKHVVVIMQENRSFDNYFGTYPGAVGFPTQNGQISVCVPDPKKGGCDQPYHNPADVNASGPHSHANQLADINGGKMDGFVAQAEAASDCIPTLAAQYIYDVNHPDVMGNVDQREIPNYWTYAQNFVLHDHMFAPVTSWSLPVHLFLLSEWSALCSKKDDPTSCVNEVQNTTQPPISWPGAGRRRSRRPTTPGPI